jgi:hypothetical protein
MSAEPIHRTTQSELGRAQALDEVSAPALTCLLKSTERSVSGTEATFRVFRQNAATRHHPIAIEDSEDVGRQAVACGLGGSVDDRPAARRCW